MPAEGEGDITMSPFMAIVAVSVPVIAVVVSIALIGFASGSPRSVSRFNSWANRTAEHVDIQALVIGALAFDVLGLLVAAYVQHLRLNDAREDIEYLQRAVLWQQSVIVGDMSREEDAEATSATECAK
jgi:hypothetical protein